jgi:hypothetical protein
MNHRCQEKNDVVVEKWSTIFPSHSLCRFKKSNLAGSHSRSIELTSTPESERLLTSPLPHRFVRSVVLAASAPACCSLA